MSTLQIPPETQPHVEFRSHHNALIYPRVVASLAGNPHELEFSIASGDVYDVAGDDNPPRRIAHHLSRRAFTAFAHDFFHDQAPDPRSCCGRGAGWQYDYGWNAYGAYDALRTPCPTCNPQAVAS